MCECESCESVPLAIRRSLAKAKRNRDNWKREALELRERVALYERALELTCEDIGASNHRENVRKGSPVESGVWFIENPADIREFYLTQGAGSDAG